MSGVVKNYMSTSHSFSRHRVSTSAISIALLICSGLWLVAACEYNASSGFKADWSATPLPWMLTVVMTPAICFAGSMVLVDQRKQRPLRLIELWALMAAFLPVTLGTLLSVWAVRALFQMSGV
jgi:cytochrome bd-type quinol oxidase subunit 2